MRVSNKIRRVFSPLSVNVTHIVTGSALAQVFKAITTSYEPNRVLTPTVITPKVLVEDIDGVFENGNANRKLGSIKWFVNGVDVTTTNDYTNGLYAIDLSDTSTRGALTIYKNVAAAAPVILSFEAILPDTRTGNNIKTSLEHILLTTQDVSADKYTLEIDQPVDNTYNPISDVSAYVVNPVVFLGENKITDLTGLTFALYYMSGTNAVLCTASNSPELISLTAGVATFDLRLISKRDYLLKLIKATVEQAAVQFSLQRKYPSYTLNLRDYGDIRKNQNIIPATAVIHAGKTLVSNPGLYFVIAWKTYSPSLGEVSHSHGEHAQIPAQITGVNLGPVDVYCDVDEKPAMQVASDNLGEVYTDSLGEQYIFN